MGQQPPKRQQPFEQPQWGQQVPPQYPQPQRPHNGWSTPNPPLLYPQFQQRPQQSGQFQPSTHPPYLHPQFQPQQNSIADQTTQPEIDRVKPNRTGRGGKRGIAVVLLVVSIMLLISGGLGYFLLQQRNSQHSGIQTRISINGIPVVTGYPPTPGAARTTYTNTSYHYTFVYPSEWRLQEYTQQPLDIVEGKFQVIAGDNYPFEVICQANPDGLDAQTWFNKMENAGTGIGDVSLPSGLTAYLSVEKGQTGSQTYTFTHNHVLCDFIIFIVNQANDAISNTVVNSFKWQ